MNKDLLNLVPSNWRPTNNYPDLTIMSSQLAIDVETYDPNLKEMGPGAIRKDGYVIGFSVANDCGFKGYYPINHEGGDNVENPKTAIRWLKDMMKTDIPKIGANILYDLIWLKCDLGVDVKGKKYDVQVADPLLNENKRTYKLNALAKDWLNETKLEKMLLQAGSLLLGLKPKKEKNITKEEQQQNIINQVKNKLYQLPARYVGEYGEGDADLPIRIFDLQEKELKKIGLWDIFQTESKIIDLLFNMWIKGVPVDINKAEEVKDQLSIELRSCMRKIKSRVGNSINIWAAEDITKACKKLGLKYPLTDKENPSFTADWLKVQDHAFFKLLLEARQLDRSGSVFIEKKILDFEVNGYIHPQFWQVKSDRYGTVSGRFSSSNPNAQQFPARNERLAKLIRSILVCEKGKKWGRFDYSQQEPRLTVHYASLLNLPSSDKAVQAYINNPKTDYHQWVSDMTQLERKTAKNVNLGLTYGMGPKKYAEKYNKSIQEAYDLYAAYHKGLSFIKPLMSQCERVAKNRGFIKTIGGRLRHFNLYGPPTWRQGDIPKEYSEAIKKFGKPVVRYFTYRAMNGLIQGSAADMIKEAMVQCFDNGYVPCMTVHDELDFCDLTTKKQFKEIHDIMRDAFKLKVPIVVDVETGKNWGELKEMKL